MASCKHWELHFHFRQPCDSFAQHVEIDKLVSLCDSVTGGITVTCVYRLWQWLRPCCLSCNECLQDVRIKLQPMPWCACCNYKYTHMSSALCVKHVASLLDLCIFVCILASIFWPVSGYVTLVFVHFFLSYYLFGCSGKTSPWSDFFCVELQLLTRSSFIFVFYCVSGFLTSFVLFLFACWSVWCCIFQLYIHLCFIGSFYNAVLVLPRMSFSSSLLLMLCRKPSPNVHALLGICPRVLSYGVVVDVF